MSFTTQIFLFIFFPVCFLCYYIVEIMERNRYVQGIARKLRIRDIVLIVFGMGFYMWACFDDIFRLIIYIICIYAAGKIIERRRNGKVLLLIEDNGEAASDKTDRYKKISWALPWLCISVAGVVFCLIYFKYTYILADVWNFLFRREIKAQSYLAPLGISFITFSAVSYLVDIYRGDETAGSLLDCALYLSFFPKVVSGPVVLWKDFKKQISVRTWNIDKCVYSLNRIMLGFAKKLILADQFGAFIAGVTFYKGGMDPLTTLGTMFAYMLQIYFDFSGYSDIAIGLAGLFGFEFKENFNFPYCSKSVSEFWRRWHISLGTWFREYVYIPMGGSRCGKRITIRNQAVVFLLTGIWHGAGWSYLLWGGINGLFVILEKLVANKKIYQKTPNVVKWFFTMTITFIAWQLFRFPDMEDLKICFGSLFAQYPLTELPYTWKYYFDARIIFLMIVGTLGSTLFGWERLKTWCKKATDSGIGFLIQELVVFVLFIVAILCMVNSTYSPFIYFQY